MFSIYALCHSCLVWFKVFKEVCDPIGADDLREDVWSNSYVGEPFLIPRTYLSQQMIWHFYCKSLFLTPESIYCFICSQNCENVLVHRISMQIIGANKTHSKIFQLNSTSVSLFLAIIMAAATWPSHFSRKVTQFDAVAISIYYFSNCAILTKRIENNLVNGDLLITVQCTCTQTNDVTRSFDQCFCILETTARTVSICSFDSSWTERERTATVNYCYLPTDKGINQSCNIAFSNSSLWINYSMNETHTKT